MAEASGPRGEARSILDGSSHLILSASATAHPIQEALCRVFEFEYIGEGAMMHTYCSIEG